MRVRLGTSTLPMACRRERPRHKKGPGSNDKDQMIRAFFPSFPVRYRMTVSVTVIVCVLPPPVPFTVMV